MLPSEQPLPKEKPQPPFMSNVFSAYSRWRAGDHEAILVVGDGHHLVHLLDLGGGEARPGSGSATFSTRSTCLPRW